MAYTWYELALLIAGAATALRVGTGFLLSLYSGLRCFVLPKLGLGIDLRRKFGKWAVVTGATDGIGKAYAMDLASRGINVVLVSRSEEKLAAVAQEIRSAHKEIETRVVCADFGERSQSLYDEIASQIEDLDIGILVNNVGAGFDHPDYFHELSPEIMWQVMIVNMASVTLMTRALLPRFIAQRRGAVINISSYSGTSPHPLLNVYSAAKAFVDTLTQSLIGEYGHHEGITIQSVRPMFVATNMSRIKRPSLFVPSAKGFAREALGTVGVVDVTTGCLSHWIQSSAIELLPSALRRKVTLSILSGIREKALKRKKRSD